MNVFLVHLSNYNDLYLKANLSGNEANLNALVHDVMVKKHGAAAKNLTVTRAFRVS